MSYSSYVDSYSDLASVWKKISSSPDSVESKHWTPKGATSKEEFGRIHWGESGEGEGRSLTSLSRSATPTGTSTSTATSTATSTGTVSDAPIYDEVASVDPTDEPGYATNLVAGMPKLGAPPKIADPAQRTVKPQELVEWRMSEMMQQHNPYTFQAIRQAKQWANQSGLLNTSIASSAGIDAAIKSILPIAQQDAATLSTQALENQRTVNEFLMQDFLTKSQFKLTEYGHMANTYNQGLQQAHDKNEEALRLAWQERQNKLDRELDIWKAKFGASIDKELADMGYEFGHGDRSSTCVNNATDRWVQAVAKIDSERSTMSSADYNAQISNAKATYNQQVRMCQ